MNVWQRLVMLVMNDLAIARAVHVLAVVIWIGGVGMVTTVILPVVRRARMPTEGQALLEAVEQRFIWQARIATLLVAASGFYMVERLDLWDRFRDIEFWWMHRHGSAMADLHLCPFYWRTACRARTQETRFAAGIEGSPPLHAMAPLGAPAVERNHGAGCSRR